MPGRTTPLVNDYFYHIYNRGADKRNIFLQLRDYRRFFQTFNYYRFIGPKPRFSKFAKSDLISFSPDPKKKLVDIVCYCLMPNHFHFLIKQLRNNGVSTFISQICNSYTKYFNTKNRRIGPLFQGAFKAVLIETDEQLIHVSRYIHLNPIVSGVAHDLNSYFWSSYYEYVSGKESICSTGYVLDLLPSRTGYQKFVEEQIDYGITLELLKHQTIDLEK